MSNGTQLQAADAVGNPQPADPQPAVPLPAGAGALPAVRVRQQRRPPLTVIPRRVTGTHMAIPALPTAAPDGSGPAGHGPVGPATQAPVDGAVVPHPAAGPARRIRLLAGSALLLAFTVAIPLWVNSGRPTATAQQAVPIAADLPGDPVTGGGPSGTGTAPLDPADDRVGRDDWLPPGGVPTDPPQASASTVPSATGPGNTEPDGTDPQATEPETTAPRAPAPGGAVPTTEPTDAATQEPPDAAAPPVDRGRANTAGRNLALNRPIFASSFANRLRSPAQAVDGSLLSRWSTRATNAQWIAVDLGDTWRISRVRIAWELAFADTYRVDLSSDGRSWTPVWQTRAGLGGTVGIPLGGATARYVRVFGVRPAGPFGYSIRELDVR